MDFASSDVGKSWHSLHHHKPCSHSFMKLSLDSFVKPTPSLCSCLHFSVVVFLSRFGILTYWMTTTWDLWRCPWHVLMSTLVVTSLGVIHSLKWTVMARKSTLASSGLLSNTQPTWLRSSDSTANLPHSQSKKVHTSCSDNWAGWHSSKSQLCFSIFTCYFQLHLLGVLWAPQSQVALR